MTEQALQTRPVEPELTPFEVIERVIGQGDLAKMSPEDRIAFYWRTCESLGLNPLTRPFEFMSLNGKITMYAKKDATDQLRRVNRVSVTELRREANEALGIYTVYAHVKTPDGREDESSGIVNIKGMSGEALANAIMKAETKAKRRATLSLVGLGFLDESEVEGLGEPIHMDDDGSIVAKAEPKSLLEQVRAQAETLAEAPAEFTTYVEPGPEPEPEFTFQPMPVEVSAAIGDDEAALLEEARAAASADNDTTAAEITEEIVELEKPQGLSIQDLAKAAKVGGIGKAAFAKALNVPAGDLGKTIEGMTDVQRYQLGQSLGIVAP